MNQGTTKINYLELLQDSLRTGVTVSNGQVTLQCKILENAFNALLQKISILFHVTSKFKTDDSEQNKFCYELNWLYSHILFTSIHNDQSSLTALIDEVLKMLTIKCNEICPLWFKMFVDHQFKILDMYEKYADLKFPVLIEINGSDEKHKLQYAKIALTKQKDIENITRFALTSLRIVIEAWPSAVRSCSVSLGHVGLNVFKCSKLEERVSALMLLCKYMEVHQCSDSIEIFTKVMEHCTCLYQNYQPLIVNDLILQERYTNGFQHWLINFCASVIKNQGKFLSFKTSLQQKLFFLISLDTIFYESKFSEETKMPSKMEELVETVDIIMYQTNFTEESVTDTLAILVQRFSLHVCEIFSLLKYGIILELERAKRFNCKVTALSETWKTLHNLLIAKLTSNVSNLEMFYWMEWIYSAIDTASQTLLLFTRRHQIHHLDNLSCKRCYMILKLPYDQQTMKIDKWDYDHIHLDFFEDLNTLAKNLIERVSQIEIDSDAIIIKIMNVFVKLLDFSIDASSNGLSDGQKVFMVSVIFLPFYNVLETNATYNVSPELSLVKRSLTENFKRYLKTTISKYPNFYASMKQILIGHMSQMRLSEIGSIATWLGTSITHHILNKETDEKVREKFIANFPNLLISNAKSMEKYLQIYQKFDSNFTNIKSHFCLMSKDVIIIQHTSPLSSLLNKETSYELFCRSCHAKSNIFKNAKNEIERLSICMWNSTGIVISLDKINLVNKFRIDYHNIQKGSLQNLIQSLEACIRHDDQFKTVMQNDNGAELLEILLKLDADTLSHTEYYFDDIINSIIESSRIGRDVKINFFEVLRNKLLKMTAEVRNNTQDVKIHKHFVGIIGAYGMNTKNIPSDKKTFFRSDFLAIESFKAIMYFMFGKDCEIITHAVDCSQIVLRENDMTFQQAINVYRRILLQFISYRTLIEAIESNNSFYEIMKNFFLLFGFNDFIRFFDQNFNEIIAFVLPVCMRNGRDDIIEDIISNTNGLDLAVKISPSKLYECFYSLSSNEGSMLQQYIENLGQFTFTELFAQLKIYFIQEAAIFYNTKGKFFVEVVKKVLEVENKPADNIEMIINYVAEYFLGIMLHFNKMLYSELTDRSEKEAALISTGELLRFIGPPHASTVCFKVMGLLKSTIKKEYNQPFKRLYIEIWRILIRTCDLSSLGPFLSVLFVGIEPYIEDFPEKVDEICEFLLHQNASTLSIHISDLFFIEKLDYSDEIKHTILSQIASQSLLNGNDIQTNLDRLIRHMNSENADSDVKFYCLQYLHQFSKNNRKNLNQLIFTPMKTNSIIADLLCVLIDCSRTANEKLLIQTGTCLGEIGALAPELHMPMNNFSQNLGFDVYNDNFVVNLLNILFKYYKDLQADNFNNLEALGAAIQEIIRERSITQRPSDPIWTKLSESARLIMKPLFSSHYAPINLVVPTNELIFWNHAQTSADWAHSLSTVLIESIKNSDVQCFFNSLNGNTRFYDEIASLLLPYIILHYFALNPTQEINDRIVKEFNYVFDIIREKRDLSLNTSDDTCRVLANKYFVFKKKDESENASTNPIVVARKVAKLILDVLDFFTRYLNQVHKNADLPIVQTIRRFHKLFTSEVLAEVCFNCGEYHRAFIYFEDYYSELSADERKKHWPLLIKIYAKLGDGDSIQGVAEMRIAAGLEWSPRQRLFIGNISGDWQDPFTCIEKIMNEPKIEVEDIEAALNCYIQHNKCQQGVFVADEMLQKLYDKNINGLKGHDVKADALLRLSKFDEISEILDANQEAHWGALSAKLHLKLRSGDHLSFLDEMKNVRLAVMKNFKLYESNQSVYKLNYQEILRLHMLTDFDKAGEVIYQIRSADVCDRVDKAKEVTQKLIDELNARKDLFQLTAIQTESIVSLHRMLLGEIQRIINIYVDKDNARDLIKMIDNEIGDGLVECAKVFCIQGQLDQANAFLTEAESYQPPCLFIQKAKYYRKQKKCLNALKLLTYNCDELRKQPDSANNPHLAKGLLMIARYNAEDAIVDDKENREMFNMAIASNVDREKAYLCYADYLDRIIIMNVAEINTIDVNKVSEVLKAYGNSLNLGSTTHVLQSLPRFLQIWFDATMPQENAYTRKPSAVSSHNATLNSIVKKLSLDISTGQFYTAYSTLVSRICHPCPEVFAILKGIIARLFSNYPKQSLWYVVYAMKNNLPNASDRLRDILKTVPKENAAVFEYSSFIDKILEFSKASESYHPIQIDRINKAIRSAKSQLLMPLQQNLMIFASTATELTGYEHIHITGMSDEILVLNSLQKPKAIKFFGNDGKEYKMLVKSKDDLRIDFRFMEFLKVVNDYFKKDPDSSQRLFSIRTYSVVPINEACGIIEWLNDYEKLRSVLFSQYAHMKIPVPINPTELKKYNDIWNQRGRNRIETFNEMKKKFPPVLDKWYQRHFSNPQEFFSARNFYTRSTAIMSVIGYFFGLGDRHLENILVNTETGELTHIDFNSMFNASENLTVPETVPFRLTQNMVAALGVLGAQGSFRKCCEIVVRLLQTRKNVLVSYLRPFVFDPLIKTLHGENTSINQKSLNAIRSVQQKLDGFVRKFGSIYSIIPLSTEGIVKIIIEESTSDENLSVMYFYWSPYI